MTNAQQQLSRHWRLEKANEVSAAKDIKKEYRDGRAERRRNAGTMEFRGRTVERFNPDKHKLWI